MISFLLSCTLFSVELVGGLFVYAQMVLPLIYGLPMAVYLYSKRKIKFIAIPAQLISPAIWIVTLSALLKVLDWFYPTAIDALLSNNQFMLSQLLSIALLLGNFLRPKGRADMQNDFLETTYRRFARGEEGPQQIPDIDGLLAEDEHLAAVRRDAAAPIGQILRDVLTNVGFHALIAFILINFAATLGNVGWILSWGFLLFMSLYVMHGVSLVGVRLFLAIGKLRGKWRGYGGPGWNVAMAIRLGQASFDASVGWLVWTRLLV